LSSRGKEGPWLLVDERRIHNPLVLKPFDAWVLHIIRRGYSAQDHPGERFDIWVIDRGTDVDLI
jgi:hypothetical protein